MIKELQESIKYPLTDEELKERMEHKRKLDMAHSMLKQRQGRVM